MYGNGWMDGSNWVWMSFMMAFVVVLLGAVIYLAIQLGSRSSDERKHR